MPGTAPPPDFRYVGLEPGPARSRVRRVAGAVGLTVALAGITLGGAELWPCLAAGLVGALTAWLVLRHFGPAYSATGGRERLAIVPWGVIVWSDEVPRTLRWAALRRVDVSYVHEMDHATPSTRWSVVTIATDAETLQGRASGQVPLDRVEAHFAHYANEASRPLALDLDGRQPLDDFLEPVIERLVAQARHLLHVGELGAQLELVPASYREARGTLAGRGREGALMVALRSPPVAAADPRPLAALLAAELSARELLPDVLALTTAPGPLLAAVARAAALRLGADPSKVGALEELEAFVDPRELFELRAWLSQAEGAAPRLAA